MDGRHHRPDPTAASHPVNGHQFEIAMALGGLAAESRRHTEIMLEILDRQIRLPDQLTAAVMPIAATPAQPPPPSPPPGLAQRLGTFRDWIIAAVAISALAGAIVGKVPWTVVLDLLRELAKS